MGPQQSKIIVDTYKTEKDRFIQEYIDLRKIESNKVEKPIIELRRKQIHKKYKPVNVNKKTFSKIKPWVYKFIEKDLIKRTIDDLVVEPQESDDPEIQKMAFRKNEVNFSAIHPLNTFKILADYNAPFSWVYCAGKHDNIETSLEINPPKNADEMTVVDWDLEIRRRVDVEVSKSSRLASSLNLADYFDTKINKEILINLTKNPLKTYTVYLSDINKLKEDNGLKFEEQIDSKFGSWADKLADRIDSSITKKIDLPDPLVYHNFEKIRENIRQINSREIFKEQIKINPSLEGHIKALESSYVEQLRLTQDLNRDVLENKYVGKFGKDQIPDVMKPAFILSKIFKNILVLNYYNRFIHENNLDSDTNFSKYYEITDNLKNDLLKVTKNEIVGHLEYLIRFKEVDTLKAIEKINLADNFKIKDGYKTLTKEKSGEKYKLDGLFVKLKKTLDPPEKYKQDTRSYRDVRKLKKRLNTPQEKLYTRGFQEKERLENYRLEEFDYFLQMKYVMEEFEENPLFTYSGLSSVGTIVPSKEIGL